MTQYEAVFIMNPVLSDEQVGETVSKFKSLLDSKEGKVLNEESWGLKKLAYPIQHKRSGFYHLLEFQAPGDLIQGLKVVLTCDERIMRFLTMIMDKHRVAFAEERHKKMQKA